MNIKERDFTRLVDFLGENPDASIVLFPGEDFEFVAISPLLVAVEDFGYSIRSVVSFQQLIGFNI
jgi:hypothetical protein